MDYLFLEDQLADWQTGKDLAVFLEEENFLQKYRYKKVFKEALKVVGGNDLTVKWEKYVAIGTS